MTLVNPAEKITSAPLIGRPATQEEIEAIQRFEARMMSQLSTIRTSVQKSSDAIYQCGAAIDELTNTVRETSDILRDTIEKIDIFTGNTEEASMSVTRHTLCQQIGQFFVRAFRYIGLIR